MTTYVRKSLEVEALQLAGVGDIIAFIDIPGAHHDPITPHKIKLWIPGQEPVDIRFGDYLVKGVSGEYYAVDAGAFETTHTLKLGKKEAAEADALAKRRSLRDEGSEPGAA